MLNDFLAGEDHFFCSKCRFAHDAEISPDVGVARTVGTLDVKNGHIGLNRSDGEEFLSGEGAGNRGKLRALAEIASSDGAGRKKWKSGRCRMQSKPDGKIRVLFDFDGVWNFRLGGT